MWKRLLAAAAGCVAVAHLARASLRNLWRIIPDAAFADIFRQIEQAPMRLPWPGWMLLTLLALAWAWSMRKKRLCGLKAGSVLLVGYLCALALTMVNGVMFADVLMTLAPLLLSGAL